MIEIRKRYFVLWFHASIATFLSKQSRTKYAPQPPFSLSSQHTKDDTRDSINQLDCRDRKASDSIN